MSDGENQVPSAEENQMPSPTIPIEQIDALKFAALDSEVKFILSTIEATNQKKKVVQLQQTVANQKAELQMAALDRVLQGDMQRLEEVNTKYEEIKEHISRKYDVDLRRMSIDEEKGVIREIPVPV